MATKVTDTASVRLMLKYPFWSELFYSMQVIEDPTIGTLATDGRAMWVSPAFFSGLSLDLKVAALAHEIIHKMLHHCTRVGNRDRKRWNVACDEVVNTLLLENGFSIGADWVQPCHERSGWTAEAIYNVLPESEDGSGADGMFDDVQPFKGTPEEVEAQEAKTENDVSRALTMAQGMGNMPKGIAAAITVTYTPKEEPWFNHLQRYMQAMTQAEFNWQRMNKRYAVLHRICAPANYHEALGEVVVMIDASGSVFDAASQSNFASHINAILAEAKPQKVHVCYFDTKVCKQDELEPGMIEFESVPAGGGGTCFIDCFDWCEREGIAPAVMIVLTDGYGTFPQVEPDFPVVWTMITDVKAPFGETIHVH